MSYARMGPDSDVYVYYSCHDKYVCCMCALEKDGLGYREFDEPEEILEHLLEHTKAGHIVPYYCTDRLKSDLTEREG